MNSVNLVTTFWTGNRRQKDPRLVNDHKFLLNKQIEYLTKISHNLAQITFVINSFVPDLSFFDACPRIIQNTPVRYRWHDNTGISYGAFSKMFNEFHADFDYFIYNEDDYFFVAENFDSELIRILTSLGPSAGALCGHAGPFADLPVHMGGMNVLFPTNVLEKVWARENKLPHGAGAEYADAEQIGQVHFSRVLLELGYTIHDWGHEYASLYLMQGNTPVKYHAPDRFMIKCVQGI